MWRLISCLFDIFYATVFTVTLIQLYSLWTGYKKNSKPFSAAFFWIHLQAYWRICCIPEYKTDV